MQEQDFITADTHSIIKDMVAAGVSEQHAEAYMSAISRYHRYDAATKADVANIQRDIAELRKETKRDIETLRQETKREIAELRKETKHDIEALRKDTLIETTSIRKDIELLKRDLTIRMGGIMVTGIAILGAFKFI